MGIAAQFDPEVVQADDFAEPFGPKEVRSPLVQGHDILISHLG